MSSSHCLGKSRHSRQERVSIRRATVPILANGNRGKSHLKYCTISNEIFQLEAHSLIDAVTAQDYDRGKNEILRLIN